MTKHNQNGSTNSLVVIVSLSFLLILALVVAIWAYTGRQHYKNDTQAIVDSAVKKAQNQQIAADNAQFAQQEQNPLNTYNGPETFGSFILKYPKTWSGYVDNDGTNNSNTYAAYFNPGLVPSVSGQGSAFALKILVLSQSYSQTLQGFSQNGVTSTAYALPSLPKVVGVEVNGPIGPNQNTETMVVLPLRSNTLEIVTDGTQNLSQFNSIILQNFSFSP